MPETAKSIQRNLSYVQLFLLVGGLIATVWVVIYFDLQRTREDILAKSRGDLTNLTLAFSKEIESSVKTIDVSLLDLRERWQENPARFAAAVRNRQTYLEREFAFQIAVIDSRGKLAFSSLEQSVKPLDLSDREHFQVHRTRSTDELFISKPVLGRLSNRWSIQFTRPIYDSNNQFTGVIVLSVSPEYFYQFYRSSTLPTQSTINLVRDTGEVLSRYPNAVLALGRSFTPAPFLNEFAPESGIFQRASPFDGVERLLAWRKLDRYKLVVAVGYSINEILTPYRQQRYRNVLAGTILSLLLLLIGYMKLLGIRQQQQAAMEMEENEERWRLALEAAGDGVWDWNVPQSSVAFSTGWKTMLGYMPDEIGTSLDEWKKRVHPDDMAQVMEDVNAHFSGKTDFYMNEHRVLCKNGNWKWILDRGMVISRDKDGNPVRMVGTHTDISSRKEMEEVLKNLATTDSLTGLSNRRHFMEELEKEMARIQRYPGSEATVLVADLDFFKKINDTYGHATGDAALKHFANLLGSKTRKSDFVGRLGGEEFAVLLTETNLGQAQHFAQGLCTALRETPLKIGDQVIPMTVSIGVARLEVEDANGERALERADIALYEAKNSGRDRAVAKSR